MNIIIPKKPPIIRPQQKLRAHQITYFADVARNIKLTDIKKYLPQVKWDTLEPEQKFIQMCIRNPSFAFSMLVGQGKGEILPFQHMTLRMFWQKQNSMLIACRGFSKSFLLAAYALLRATLDQNESFGHKIILVSASFRQSKNILEYIRNFVNQSPIYDVPQVQFRISTDREQVRIGNSRIIAIPLGCLSGDTMVTTNNGIQQIKDVVWTQRDKKIWSGDQYRNIGGFHNNGLHECYNIQTKAGFQFSGTPNHKMKVVRDGKITWCRSDHMRIGDKILIDKSQRWFDSTFECTADEAYCLGLMIGDGQFKYQNDTIDFWGIKRSCLHEREVPNNALKIKKQNMAALLSGLFDSDECTYTRYNKDGRNSSISCHVTSQKLAKQIQYVLLHFGIVATIFKYNMYDINISGKNVLKFYQQIGLRIKKNKKKLDDLINAEDNNILDLLELINEDIFYDQIVKIQKTQKTLTYDVNVPSNNTYVANGFISHNTGEKVRGLRGTIILVDQFASVNEEIFNVVVRGFASVAQDPIGNVKKKALIKQLRQIGQEQAITQVQQSIFKNQLILSGTASYMYNHFYQKYSQYKNILQNRICGYTHDYQKVFGQQILDRANVFIDYKKYGMFKVPYTVLPEGYMQEQIIADAGFSTKNSSYFKMQYEARFMPDSDGFFSMKQVEACTPSISSGQSFYVQLNGDPRCKYVMGVDPARKHDNFAISIIKICPEGNKLVYVWTMRNKKFPQSVAKIWQLLKRFNIVAIAVDSGGGGLTVKDLLCTSQFVPDGEQPIWDIDDKDNDKMPGRHILRLYNFQGKWLEQANFDLRSDFEHRILLFPIAAGSEKYIETGISLNKQRNFSQAEKVYEQIVETKVQTGKIVRTVTPKTQQSQFDLPQIAPGKMNPDRKDRYSSLVLAAYVARTYIGHGFKKYINDEFPMVGGWV